MSQERELLRDRDNEVYNECCKFLVKRSLLNCHSINASHHIVFTVNVRDASIEIIKLRQIWK